MTEEAEALFETRGPLGLVTLNRPKALNALSLNMIRLIDTQLRVWAEDDAIKAIVLLGAGEKAFCAGGDVVSLAKEWDGVEQLRKDFFREEYILNTLIHTYPKPYIPLVDGISMGGGVGMSVHGSHRVVSEKVKFAMPETTIGLFPDVGGTWFLPKLRGEVGAYLALTNAQLRAPDVVYAGVYDSFVPSADLPALLDELAGADWQAGDGHATASRVIDGFQKHPGEPTLAQHQAVIDRCFGYDSLPEILDALDADGSDFAATAAQAIRDKSPLMSSVTLRQLRKGAPLSFEDCMILEYRMTQACMAGTEFFEGVRALLIDKDKNPKWSPANLEDVTEEMIERHFAPLGADDLAL